MKPNRPTIADLAAFDEIIDVRSPAEFAEDHIPGAINYPVLDDVQRAEVGTLYKQVSPFEAKKIGAAMVSENIARHLRQSFFAHPKSWKPLIYCWRGGERSGSMTTILRAIGWPAGQLDGGYKSWRTHVVANIEALAPQFQFKVIAGATGSAKTRVLQAIGELGEQIIDLEGLASHKGSVLGVLPDQPQPQQKWFETTILQQLQAFDRHRPVYVEAESRKIGNLHVPEPLIANMRRSPCLNVVASLEARVSFLLKDYDYFLTLPTLLGERLEALQNLQSRETLARWRQLIEASDWPTLVRELLEMHYDPLYRRSQNHNFTAMAQSLDFPTDDLSADGIVRLAVAVVQSSRAQIA